MVVLSACFSGMRDAALQSLAESLSHRGITCVGMWVEVADAAAVTYDVEFARAAFAAGCRALPPRTGWPCSRLRCCTRAWPGAAFLLPAGGGYGIVAEELEGVNRRLDRLEQSVEALCRTVAGQNAWAAVP